MGIARPYRSLAWAALSQPVDTDPVQRWRRNLAFTLPLIAMLPLLFVPQLGGMGPPLFLIAVALSLVPVTAAPLTQVARAWPVLAVAAFALLSTLWSIAPATTLRYTLQLALTVLTGVMIGASPFPKRSLWGVFAAFGFYAIASFALGSSVAWGGGQGTAFAGLNGGKNYLADIVAIGLLAGLACLTLAVREGRPMLIAITMLVLPIEAYILVAAKSSGAILGVVLAVGLFAGLLVLGRAKGGLKMLMALALVVGGGAVGSAMATEGQAVRTELLRVMGKDDTLTGRVYLWYRAETIMREHPLLGTGFGAFWVQGQADAEGLWAYSDIPGRMGFNFHNTEIEQRVNLGWVGFLVIATITLACTALLIVSSVIRPSVVGTFWTAFMVYELSRVGYEAIGPGPFNFGTVMMSAGLTFATSMIRRDRLTEPSLLPR